ncbi:uncharacterized protein [Clytia hemisphaerica]|uniref:Uncharacterized protein n=1 Tax=Clytia hemisphaerica TaxID=252671 RepID=A0A7M5V7E7_9CNID|eukprot:TCONS_00051571-protein
MINQLRSDMVYPGARNKNAMNNVGAEFILHQCSSEVKLNGWLKKECDIKIRKEFSEKLGIIYKHYLYMYDNEKDRSATHVYDITQTKVEYIKGSSQWGFIIELLGQERIRNKKETVKFLVSSEAEMNNWVNEINTIQKKSIDTSPRSPNEPRYVPSSRKGMPLPPTPDQEQKPLKHDYTEINSVSHPTEQGDDVYNVPRECGAPIVPNETIIEDDPYSPITECQSNVSDTSNTKPPPVPRHNIAMTGSRDINENEAGFGNYQYPSTHYQVPKSNRPSNLDINVKSTDANYQRPSNRPIPATRKSKVEQILGTSPGYECPSNSHYVAPNRLIRQNGANQRVLPLTPDGRDTTDNQEPHENPYKVPLRVSTSVGLPNALPQEGPKPAKSHTLPLGITRPTPATRLPNPNKRLSLQVASLAGATNLMLSCSVKDDMAVRDNPRSSDDDNEEYLDFTTVPSDEETPYTTIGSRQRPHQYTKLRSNTYNEQCISEDSGDYIVMMNQERTVEPTTVDTEETYIDMARGELVTNQTGETEEEQFYTCMDNAGNNDIVFNANEELYDNIKFTDPILKDIKTEQDKKLLPLSTFQFHLDKDQCARLLRDDGSPGVYLIRKGSQGLNVLMASLLGDIKNYRIFMSQNKLYLKDDEPFFERLPDLIAHYTEYHLPTCHARLEKPYGE